MVIVFFCDGHVIFFHHCTRKHWVHSVNYRDFNNIRQEGQTLINLMFIRSKANCFSGSKQTIIFILLETNFADPVKYNQTDPFDSVLGLWKKYWIFSTVFIMFEMRYTTTTTTTNNNNNRCLYSALSPTVSSTSYYNPGHWAHETFQTPSQLPGEYTARCCHFGAKKTISTLTGTHLLLGEKKQWVTKCLAQGHTHHSPRPDSNPQPAALPTDYEFNAPVHEATLLIFLLLNL